MAINFTDFSKAQILDSPVKDMFENAFKGYSMSQIPGKLADEKKQRELANQLKSLEVEHKPKEYALNDQQKSLANALNSKALEHYEEKYGQEKELREVNLKKANQPEGLKGALATAFQLRDKLDPDSPNYEQDKAAINSYINNLGQKNGAAPNMAPGQGVKINLPEGKQGYVPGLGNLKKGWQPVKDAEGNDIGVNVPMSDKQVDQWKAKEKFDIIYPFLNKSFAEYTGQDSWEKFTRDAHNYNKDPEAKSRIDNFLAAKKLVSIGSTTENARIGGHATNVQLDELKKTLDSSEVFKKIEGGSGFVLPSKYAKNSGDIFKGFLDKVEKTAKTNIPAYEFRALNPQDNAPSMEVNSSPAVEAKSNPEVISTENGITTVRNGNKTLKIPEHLVDRYIMEHSQQEFGGDYGPG